MTTQLNDRFNSQTLRGTTVASEPAKTGHQYGSQGLTYPIDMGIDATTEMDNHIIFDIYFDDSSSFQLSGVSGEPRAWKGHSAIIGNDLTGAIGNAVDTVADGAEAAGVNNALSSIGAQAGIDADTQNSVMQSIGNFTNGATGGAQSLKRLTSQIALAVPNTFTSSSQINYQEAKMGAVAGLVARLGNGNMASESIGELVGQGARLAMETASALPDAFGMNLQNIMEVTTRRVQNPHIEQRFESVSFRQYTFTYEFAARTRQEQEAIDNIIRTFRFHMHPELIPSGLYFDYPSLFDISIMFGQEENRYINKISTCYLTNFTTNYTSTGVFATTRDGMPTEVQCTMQFQEIEPMHKHRIAEGY